jgi:uncharacterized protein YbjT (DUF2867 family)
MRLFLLGATGGIGRALIDQAIERGHRVTAFVRSPEKLSVSREGLSVRKGDPRSIAEDTAEMERVVMASDLEWTIARPPSLTNGRLTVSPLPRGEATGARRRRRDR